MYKLRLGLVDCDWNYGLIVCCLTSRRDYFTNIELLAGEEIGPTRIFDAKENWTGFLSTSSYFVRLHLKTQMLQSHTIG